ncbi:hypothetical protein BCF55_0259 [Hydrogenivirga caldilitoris]|uniref:DUF507 family protein n=1 Tax=Hydrogenivirga caldilitoris TaxID=246264 RepID=A0A497XMF5_9AQUI|nr:DUF507 family protein [Hydrogenivirga caldilitoris]RLJ69998.1 hypothetical protein BCF55_0259 [Hydrogenivirga caldilitoris]
MKLPERLVERIADRIVDELTKEKIIEPEDPELFKRKIIAIFKKAEEEDRLLDEKTKEILKEKMNLLEETDLDYRTAFKAVKAKLAEEMKINVNRRERMNQIANMIRDLIMADDTVEIYEDPPVIRKKVSEVLKDAIKEEEEIERAVRAKIREYSRNILEGTPEWNILYKRIYEDELKQRGLA